MCMVNTIIWYQCSLMIRLNLPSTWGWTLTHFTIYWRYKAASELRRSVSRRPCCAFVLVKEKQCTIKVSKRLKSSVPWTDGRKRSCMHVLKKIRPCPSVSVWTLFMSPVGIKSDFLCTFFTYDSRPCPSVLVWTYPKETESKGGKRTSHLQSNTPLYEGRVVASFTHTS